MNHFFLVWSKPDFQYELIKELEQKKLTYEILSPALIKVTTPELPTLCWAHRVGSPAQSFEFSSIGEAQKFLQTQGQLWIHEPIQEIRRGELILGGLKTIKSKPRKPFEAWPTGRLGAFSLMAHNQLIFTSHLTPSLPPFKELFINDPRPPSRAYLKLWEAFSRLQVWPQPTEKTLELGSSPGGWTWVLAEQLKSSVVCLDKGSMDIKIANHPLVTWVAQDAFLWVEKQSVQEFDWVLSDMACEPERLYQLVQLLLSQKPTLKLICTIKFTDHLDLEILNKFQSIANSQLITLDYNKHELTWLKVY